MKRKITAIVLLIALTALLVPAVASAAKVEMAYKGGSLHLRKGAGTSYGSNGYVQNGDTITVLSEGSVWSKIRTADGREGYIKNLYISGIGSNYADGTTYYSSKSSGRVTTKYSDSTVNLRSGASSSTSSIAKLKSGTSLTILGENGGWYLVSTSGGTQGYMSKNYVTKGSGGSSSTTPKTAVVTGSVVNMRKGAGTNYAIVTALVKNTKVTVLSTNNSKWWKVKYLSYTGYMSRNYLK